MNLYPDGKVTMVKRNLEEIAKSYAELTPQVEPMKIKVKAALDQYFAMLPKREVAKKN